tara:strand:- start:1047 stop:2750 length:1704 start_codon:yes stop_codon:yes gene_type:complete
MATDFGPFGTLAEDDPFMLALQMQQMQGGGTQRIPLPPDPETGLSPLSGQLITPPIYTGPMTEEFSGRRIPFESVPQNPVTRVDFESNLPKTNSLTKSNQTQNMPETQAPDPLANYRSVMNRQPGFFQENAPLILGLLGGVSGLLEAMGPSRTPVSSGQVFARGLQSGLGGYMGGLKYQQGQDQARQTEGSNILKALEQKQGIQTSLDKRQRIQSLKQTLPGMYEDALNSLKANDSRRKNLMMNRRLIESAPEAALKALQSLAPRATQFKAVGNRVISIDDAGTINEVYKAPIDKPFTVNTLGDGIGMITDVRDGTNQIINQQGETSKAPFEGKGMEAQVGNLQYLGLIEQGVSEDDALKQVIGNFENRRALQGTYRIQAPVDANDPTKGTHTVQVNPDGTQTPVPGSVIKTVKEIPSKIVDGLFDMRETARKIILAQELIDDDDAQEGVGVFQGNVLPDIVLNEKAQQLRAILADLGSAKVLERSGAAVTASEETRLKPYVPRPGDSEEVIRTKLKGFFREFTGRFNDIQTFFSPERGYKKFDLPKIGSTEKKPSFVETVKKYGVE